MKIINKVIKLKIEHEELLKSKGNMKILQKEETLLKDSNLKNKYSTL